MGSLDPIPYWHYNVPEADRTPECPPFLLNLSDKDRRIVGSPDSSFTRLTWAQVRALIAANELERFQRVPSQLRRYKAYTHRQAAAYGSVAAFILAVIIQRFMLHLAVILDRAKRRSGLLKPFARGPDGIAARRALAFEHPGFLLLRRGRLSVRVEAGMGEGADALQNRRDGRKKRLAGGGGAHRPD
ncbi:MAG: hypothetical protein B7X78_11025 [Sphingomonadales bacterium 39-62-4]|nr:MAG: hypothetical protein B7X78_11025 [Sphingomonadales bacterium 39-62-4]